MGSIPGLGRYPGVGNGNPLQYSCLENPWTEEPSELQSMGLHRVVYDWAHTHKTIRKLKYKNWDLGLSWRLLALEISIYINTLCTPLKNRETSFLLCCYCCWVTSVVSDSVQSTPLIIMQLKSCLTFDTFESFFHVDFNSLIIIKRNFSCMAMILDISSGECLWGDDTVS